MLRIGVYPYESMDGWDKFNKTTLQDKGNNLEKVFVKILKQKILVNIMICILKAMHYDWLMCLETLEKFVYKFKNYNLQNFFQFED